MSSSRPVETPEPAVSIVSQAGYQAEGNLNVRLALGTQATEKPKHMISPKNWSQNAAAALHDFGWRHGSVEQGSMLGFYLPDEIGGHKGFCLGSDEQNHFIVYILYNDPIAASSFSEAVMLANALNHKLHFGSLEVTLDDPHQFVSKASLFWSSASSAREQISGAIRSCANNLGTHQMPIQMVSGGSDHKKALKLYELACEAAVGDVPIQRTRN